MTKQADLIAYIFEGLSRSGSSLSADLRAWMDASTRFTEFVETYRDKIRKKVRTNPEPESALDLRAELEVAYCLLNDRRFALAYEPYASAKHRGPDFSVTYRANLLFNIEVARLRGEASDDPEELARKEERIVRILLDKLGQMQPGMANVLVIHARPELARRVDLNRLMQAIKTRVEAKDPAFYTFSRYASPADFYKDLLRLSGMLLGAPSPIPWVNKQARPGLDERILRLVALSM